MVLEHIKSSGDIIDSFTQLKEKIQLIEIDDKEIQNALTILLSTTNHTRAQQAVLIKEMDELIKKSTEERRSPLIASMEVSKINKEWEEKFTKYFLLTLDENNRFTDTLLTILERYDTYEEIIKNTNIEEKEKQLKNNPEYKEKQQKIKNTTTKKETPIQEIQTHITEKIIEYNQLKKTSKPTTRTELEAIKNQIKQYSQQQTKEQQKYIQQQFKKYTNDRLNEGEQTT